MSLALTHFVVGAGVAMVLQAWLLPSVGHRRTLVVASGLWALVPDLHYVVPGLTNVWNEGVWRLLGNVFWFHTAMDGAETGRGSRVVAGLALAFLAGTALLADRYESARQRRAARAAERPDP